jgi:hypothetical protein
MAFQFRLELEDGTPADPQVGTLTADPDLEAEQQDRPKHDRGRSG